MMEIIQWTKIERLITADDWINKYYKDVGVDTVRRIKYLKEDEVVTG